MKGTFLKRARGQSLISLLPALLSLLPPGLLWLFIGRQVPGICFGMKRAACSVSELPVVSGNKENFLHAAKKAGVSHQEE